ncbi:MAG: hypothetical protein RL687_141 [Candidatus Parcubacteria bacterium]|jgi:hypothetical protein
MSRNTILITIGVLAITSVGGGYVYYAMNSQGVDTGSTENTSVIGKVFSPFGFGSKTGTNTEPGPVDALGGAIKNIISGINVNSKFTKLTDFSVSGVTFFIDERPLPTKPIELKPEDLEKPKEVDAKNKKLTPKITTPIEPTTEPVPSIRYMRRSSGHIYQTYLDTNITGKISNSTIPEIYDGLFGSNPNNIIYRLLGTDGKTIKTVLGVLGGKESGFLPDNVIDIAIAPNGTNFFYLTPNSNGSTGTIGSFTETKKSLILNSAFSEWLVQWPVDQTMFLTTKASYDTEGYIYSLPTLKGSLKKVMGGVRGLTTLVDPSGDKVLYSSTTDRGPSLSIYTISTNKYTPLNLYGLPEKCVWAKDSVRIYCAIPANIEGDGYPDIWYQGKVSFNDKFLRINTEVGTSTEVADSNYETAVDATKLVVDDKEQTLFFINKKDYTLWSLNLQ